MVTYDRGVGLAPELEEHLRSNPFSARQGQGVVGWIAKQRLPALVPKVKDDPRWIQLTRLTQSVVGVPVEHEKELRGVLMAGRTQDVPFTAQDERLLILFANQVAAAMELTRLFQAQKQRQHELEILREASLAFAAASDRATLANLILQFSLRLVTAQNAFLFFYENEELEYGGMLWAQDSPMPPQRFTPRREGLTYTVAQSGRMVVIDDVNSHPLFSSWRWGGAIIGLPLKAGGEVRAVLNVAHEQPHQFATEELHALELFADQAAAALENARRFQEMEREIERLSLPEHAVAAAGSARQSHDWRNE
jgi:GAF domain-containing protein